jgi:APA family basic amino acid/polyamine antiporter
MIVVANVFAVMGSKYEYVNGVVDYAEATVGKRYAYFIGWFMTTIYNPAITSVLAWVSARYTCVLLGWPPINSGECLALAGFYLVAIYAMNVLSPILAGRFQVSTPVIKLIPLLAMGVFGIISGLINGLTVQNFTAAVSSDIQGNPLFAAIVATAFAYEGWIIATSINSELRDAKKNLPRALTIGSLVIVAVYILYYVGLAGAATNEEMMGSGAQGVRVAFGNIFGGLGSLLFVFVIISCLGTLNGLMMGTARGMYALAVRKRGPKPEMFAQVDQTTNMPNNSGALGVALCGLWLFFFYGANLTAPLFGWFAFDSSELPIVALYGFYIPIFIRFMQKEKDLPVFKRAILPCAGILCCLFMLLAAYIAHGITAILSLAVVFAVSMGIGALFGLWKKPEVLE